MVLDDAAQARARLGRRPMSYSATPTRRFMSVILAIVLTIGGAYSLYSWGRHGGENIVVLVGTFAFLAGIIWTGVETTEFLRGTEQRGSGTHADQKSLD
jgi:hypothetical protein